MVGRLPGCFGLGLCWRNVVVVFWFGCGLLVVLRGCGVASSAFRTWLLLMICGWMF